MVDFVSARRSMVESQIHAAGVHDRRLLAVLGALPRENFVPAARRQLAYIDDLHRLGGPASTRFLAAPAVFARLVQLAAITPDDVVLDIGAGSGYSTVAIAALARQVVGLEEDADLAAWARSNLETHAVGNAEVILGDHDALGNTRFDAIILEGAIEAVPPALIDRLQPGGRLVALLRRGDVGTATVFTATAAGTQVEKHFNASLPPLYAPTSNGEFVF